jgi:hypothetical protein
LQQSNVDVSSNIVDLLKRVDDPVGVVDYLIASPGEEANRQKLEAIRPLAEQAQLEAVQAPQPNLIGNILPFIIAPIVIIIVGTIVAILWGMFIFPNLVEPILRRRRGEQVSAEVVQERKARVEAAKMMETRKTDFAATSNFGPPLMQKMSTYSPGFGTYDESYTIEDEQERFLGECGALVSETIGTGDPKATAIEVWLFDKDDFVRTVTKVFASEFAFNDPATRSKLEAKGDLVLAQPGATVTMETNTLRLQARVVEVQYGTGPLPPNSYFEKMTVELAAWRKQPSGTPEVQSMPAPQPAVVTPPPPSMAAPVRQQPAFQPPPPPANPPSGGLGSGAGAPLRPAGSQPLPRPQPDDDPFGGTGDFTPIS